MNRISEQLLAAAETIAEEKVSKLKYDKTIQAKIFSIVDLDTGEYKVRYNGNIFSAYSNDLSKSYNVDNEVYVIVPEGDFSNKKLIASLVSAESLSYNELTSLQNSVMEISPPFDELYQSTEGPLYNRGGEYGVIAGIEPGSAGSQAIIYDGPQEYNPSDYHGLFQQYANKYEYIKLEAYFKTQLHCIHTQGNYGIEVEFYAKEDGVVSYRLDLPQFNGSSYSFSSYSPQMAVIKVQKNYLLGLKSIKLFEENFIPDRLIRNGIVTDEQNLTVPNIFVKDITLQYVDMVDLSATNYYLTIAAPKGIAFSSSTSSLDLVARLVYQGKDIMDDQKCDIKWYQRDLSVMIGSPEFNKDAGFGWKLLNSGDKTITIDAIDVEYKQQYKLVVVYNGKITLTAETELTNTMNQYDYSIIQRTDAADIILSIFNNLDDGKTLVGDWYISYPDGSYELIDEKLNSVIISPYLQYSSLVFYCAVYDGDKYLGVLEHTMMNSESSEDVTIGYIGEDTFRYDANGDIAIEDSEKERTLQVSLTWKEGYGTSYTVEWLMRNEDGSELKVPTDRTHALTPPDSMMQNIWVDNYNILHYTIKQKYKVNFNNNTLTVKIKTISDAIYLFQKEILFLKDGDQGTNGTTYVTAVRPCSDDGVKLAGLHPLVYNEGWVGGMPLRCYVYKDGELINNDLLNYGLTFRWTGVNVYVNNVNELSGEDSQVFVRGYSPIAADSILEYYVKVQVDIVERARDGQRTTIYASYPLDVAIGGIDYSRIDISDIPSYIKYTSSGLTPQFYSNDINYYYDNVPYNEYIRSLNTNLLDIKDQDGKKYLDPVQSFIFENPRQDESNIAILELRDPSSEERRLIHPIIMYLDTYGNEAINGWDGTELDTGNGEYVFAPQIGAGGKDSANRFTGVVMGKDSGQKLFGLYGYQSGVNTFGLKEDGTAFFGAKSGGGQIVIDGTKATIYGGDGGDNETGMTITLADLNPDRTTDAIKVGGGVFRVTYDGAIYATSADITGKIYAQEGQIGCDSRKQGGWKITSNRISSGSGSNTVALDSSDSDFSIWAGRSEGGSGYTKSYTDAGGNFVPGNITSPAKFVVTKDGFVYAEDVKIKGYIESGSGKIGGWDILRSKLQSSNGSVGMASSGNAAFWVGAGLSDNSGNADSASGSSYFLVTRGGKLYCRSADIQGSVTATSGKIGDWVIDGSLRNESGSVYLSPTGLRVGDNFSVSSGGILTATGASISGNITATSGKIGGWQINQSSLSGGNTTLNSNGTINASALNVYQVSIKNNNALSGSTLGTLGWIEGEDSYGSTDNIGISSQGSKTSIILKSARNVAFTGSTLYMTVDAVYCSASAANQHGIYARFA